MKMKNKTLKIVLSLFFLNSITIYLYLSSHPDYHHRRRTSSPENRHYSSLPQYHPLFLDQASLVSSSSSNKPWPILPSYLPWSLTSNNVPVRSCEAYFGNGFTRRVDLLRPSPDIHRKLGNGGGGGWFRCFYSQTLHSSICEGGKMRMHPEKIKMSNGGEDLKTVIGRSEDEELPEYDYGAFDIEVSENSKSGGNKLASEDVLDEYLPRGEIWKHTMRDLIESIKLVRASEFECSEWVEEPTLFVTRFEYANVFHTVTDWYSAYVSSRVTGLPNRPRVVFVDGHCKTILEETWEAVFSGLRYAKNFSGPVCFRHAIFSPLGYETAMFRGLSENIDCDGTSAQDLWQNPNDTKTARISEFGEMIRASFSLPLKRRHLTSNPFSRIHKNVLFVRREDYLAHPRHGGRIESRLSNEQQVFDAIKNWALTYAQCKVNVINGLLAHMPMKEQVKAIQDASVIVGAHGAGLTHMISATTEAEILEIIAVDFMRPHFELISKWKGLKYHPIYLMGSFANPRDVIDKLKSILRSQGC